MIKKNPNESTEIAGRTYHVSDYQSNDTLSSGLAATHEQVSDTYMQGDISEAVFDNGGDSSEGLEESENQ